MNTTTNHKEHTMNKLITGLAIIALAASTYATANADDGCYTVDYQGAPADICPPPEPDPTNCYTGWYQGAPIEVCMPTGATLPEGTTYNGEPVVIHNATGYKPPAIAAATVDSAAAVIVDAEYWRSIITYAAAATVGTYFAK